MSKFKEGAIFYNETTGISVFLIAYEWVEYRYMANLSVWSNDLLLFVKTPMFGLKKQLYAFTYICNIND